MVGSTSYEIPSGISHYHYYRGLTTVDNAHVHGFSGITGLAIPLAGGGHTHEYQGPTTFDFGHRHFYRALTGNEINGRLF